MPHNPLIYRANSLNTQHQDHSATALLKSVLHAAAPGKTALVSSFGAQSVVLLHMVSLVAPTLPLLFIDTQMLFVETLRYQREVCARLGLENIHIIRPQIAELRRHDPLGDLHHFDTDKCCDLRKAQPLAQALEGYTSWISGRRRAQSGPRARLDLFEAEGAHLKINPLAHWTPGDIGTYMAQNRLPKHPLLAKAYRSIGCAPCTTPVAEGEDPRAGRWRNRAKTECGIHVPRPFSTSAKAIQ